MSNGAAAQDDAATLRPHLPSIYAFVACSLAAAYFMFAIFAYLQWEKVSAAGYDKAAGATSRVLEKLLETRGGTEQLEQLARIALEQDASQKRASHVRSMILMRTWLRFVSVMVGSVLAIVGALFVFGRINSDTATTASATGAGFSVLFTTTWPGLVLAAIGGVLVALPNVASQEIQWRDAGVYLSSPSILAAPKPPIDDDKAVKAIADAFNKPKN